MGLLQSSDTTTDSFPRSSLPFASSIHSSVDDKIICAVVLRLMDSGNIDLCIQHSRLEPFLFPWSGL